MPFLAHLCSWESQQESEKWKILSDQQQKKGEKPRFVELIRENSWGSSWEMQVQQHRCSRISPLPGYLLPDWPSRHRSSQSSQDFQDRKAGKNFTSNLLTEAFATPRLSVSIQQKHRKSKYFSKQRTKSVCCQKPPRSLFLHGSEEQASNDKIKNMYLDFISR